MRNSLQGIIV